MKTLITIALLIVATTSFSKKGFATDLTDAEKKGIQLMREEEKLAHDVYLFLNEKWNLPIFSNISNSEARHFNAVGYLLETFNIEDISLPGFGKFKNSEIAFLYDSLTQKGSESLVEALKVGAFIEEFDIADLQKLLTLNTVSIIEGVYQNLLRGSNNHLRAFTGQLATRDNDYSPVVLNEKEYLTILETPHQRGGGNGNCMMQQNGCINLQMNAPARNRNRGKGSIRARKGWNY